MTTQRQVDLKLTVNAKTVQETFKTLSSTVQNIVGGTKTWKAALKSVGSELQNERQAIAKIHAQMTPGAMGKRVHLQLAREQAQTELKEREKTERLHQYKPQTAAGRLGKALGFDVTPGNAGSHGMLGGLAKKLGFGDEVAGLVGGFGKILGPFAAAAGTAIGLFKSVEGFVAKANPGAMQRMNMAWDDMIAVIGHSLTPVIEIATKSFRLMGDFLATITPSSDEVRDALKSFDDELKELRDALAEVGPYFKDFIKMNLDLVSFWAKSGAMFGGLVKLFGSGTQQKLKDSTGAAARPARIGSAEDYAKSIYTAIASGQGKEPQKETAENTKGIWDTLKEKFNWDTVGDILKSSLFGVFAGIDWGKLGDKFGTVFEDLKGKIFGEAKNFASDLSKIPENFQNAINDIPNQIRTGAANLAADIVNAIAGALPQLPGLPGLPGGGGGGGGGLPERALEIGRDWLRGRG